MSPAVHDAAFRIRFLWWSLILALVSSMACLAKSARLTLEACQLGGSRLSRTCTSCQGQEALLTMLHLWPIKRGRLCQSK